MRAQQADFGIRLQEDLDPEVGDIELVPQDMSRVFLNIANNACYATHQRQKHDKDFTPELQISTRNQGEHIEVRIADNGGGMPHGVAEKIFNPFFTTKPAREGTGLGLSLSYDIVMQHGGDISVQTEEGIGTEFLISLPQRAPLKTQANVFSEPEA
jgi:signal transduction histidine kinase